VTILEPGSGIGSGPAGGELAEYALGLGDDALVLAQRLSEWVTRAPQIEEDVAMANIALDLLGQARVLLGYAGEVEGRDRNEDDLAFLRDERQFRNLQMVEQPNGDFGRTMARQLFFSAYQLELYRALQTSADPTLAAVAGKAVKEVDYHRDHATQWVLRLGDGTPDSHARMQAGVEAVGPFLEEMFDAAHVPAALLAAGVAMDPVACRPAWTSYVGDVLAEATLDWPQPQWTATGGRTGVHTEGFGFLLAEMQNLHRSHPGASW
jgi:ring-1,2-phenylacetyl-CoA epoxidase subunit PaaC